MEYTCSLKIGAEVSLVVCLIDDYTAKQTSDNNINVFLKETPKRPIRKPDGYFVFTELHEMTYNLCVRSDIFLDEDLQVTPSQIAGRMMYVTLKPRSSYPFPGRTTLIRTAVCDSEGTPVGDAGIKAAVLSEECASAKLVNQKTESGSLEISLINVAGKILVGDMFLLKEKGEEKMEYCTIAGICGETRQYRLEQPLQFEYRRGALLLPVMHTRSDTRGEAVVCFRNLRSKLCDVKMEFTCKDKVLTREAKLEEGKTTYLGTIKMP